MTSSIRTRDDEADQVCDSNIKSEDQKEILLCFGPLIEGTSVNKHLSFPEDRTKSKVNNVSDQSDATYKHMPVKKRPFVHETSTSGPQFNKKQKQPRRQ
jgi:hypothetical protein